MGQCVSNSTEDGREDVDGGRGRGEERRSLMRHEGGYPDGEEGTTESRDRPPLIGNGGTNGHPAAVTRHRRRNGRSASAKSQGPKETRERELSDVASGEIDIYGERDCAEPQPVQSVGSVPTYTPPQHTQQGLAVMEKLSKAYEWREQFEHPSSEFLALMDRLYMECQIHLTALSSRGDPDSRREADTIVNEMVALRNYWGPHLLPSSTCNAFVRERIPLTLGVDQRQFRIDCAQFFEPVPFYGNQQSSCPGELMKLYRFSVYNVATNEVILRYYLERSNITQLYHVLCFMDDNCHGQVKPYGTEAPPYWEVRQSMLADLNLRLLNTVSPDSHPAPKPLAVTVFPTDQ